MILPNDLIKRDRPQSVGERTHARGVRPGLLRAEQALRLAGLVPYHHRISSFYHRDQFDRRRDTGFV